MKSILFSVLILVGTISTSAQTIDEVVDKHVEAIGGKEKLKNLQSLYMETVSVMQNGNEVTSKMWKVDNKLVRREVNFGMGSMTSVVTEKEGWNSNPRNDNKFEPVSPEALKMLQGEMDCSGPLVDYKAKGHTAELQGKEDVDGKECYKIKMTLKSGRDLTYYVDTKDYYIIRMKTKGGGMGGQRPGGGGGGGSAPANPDQELIIDYSDFRKTPEGYVFPYATTRVGMGAATNVEKIEVNKPVDPKLYKAE